ncbi:TetR/AcrR family transcriptional regulator [Solimonas sp. K1W22B-7]|uniref:TetR/AcrR family transcriptional regulator n=1 Tax=Solimonas sp. K1W22B-7 TaxID=2303331 RepID=UPI000E333F14|nr:TetR/AcrR family transcriptional regulator [Solimonas sp. K1W22B-7]AXQ31000.1 TetR/AcrR family transcriptional regulator [Solimonas sp. K1W22B-7]
MSLSQQRRLEEKERRREEIVDAAERVIEAKGYDAAKMEEIARDARVSRALVYTYFKDKPELYFAICERALRLLRERFDAAVASQPRGIDQVAAIGRAYMDFARESPFRFTALSRFEAHSMADVQAGSTEHGALTAGRCVHEVTVRALLNGVADGSIRKDLGHPLLMSITLWGLTHGVIQLAQTKGSIVTDEGFSLAQFLEHSIDFGLRALRA